MVGWFDGYMDGWVVGWMDIWLVGCMDGWVGHKPAQAAANRVKGEWLSRVDGLPPMVIG